MNRSRVTEEVAGKLVNDLFENWDFKHFLKEFSDYCTWYGRFGATNRIIFTDAVINEVENRIGV